MMTICTSVSSYEHERFELDDFQIKSMHSMIQWKSTAQSMYIQDFNFGPASSFPAIWFGKNYITFLVISFLLCKATNANINFETILWKISTIIYVKEFAKWQAFNKYQLFHLVLTLVIFWRHFIIFNSSFIII